MTVEIWQRQKRSEDEINKLARKILAEMTLEQKVNQMSGDSFYTKEAVDNMMENGYNLEPYYAGRDEELGIPPIAFTDGPRGIVMGNSTCFPVSMARAASWDIDLEERIADVMGIEARAQGANYYGGVCINLLRHPAWGRAQETFGEDPFLLGEFGSAQVRGIQSHNVMACIKHFAANSMENARFKVDVNLDERTLREVYLPHFKRCINEGAASVMSAYNKVRGKYCGHNEYLLSKVLKEDWNFDGFVITDFVFGMYDGEKAAKAGVDIEMPFTMHYGDKLKELVEANKIEEEIIDKAVLRILRQKLKFITAEDKQNYALSMVACKEHRELARESAEKSMVLLKNQNNILPINTDEVKKVAVIGSLANTPNTGDRGSSNVRNEYTVTPLEGIKNLVGRDIKINYQDGSDLKEVARVASAADLVIVITGNRTGDEGEYLEDFGDANNGGDRDSLTIAEEEYEILDTAINENENSIVVLTGGSVIMMEEWKERAAAILIAWYSGMEGGNALARIIFGEVNPSGKLPFTIPSSEEELPFFDKDAEEINYGYYHGYTLFDKEKYKPAFPFGYGISYTSYSYDNLQTELKNEVITVNIDVKNQGDIEGEEVVQYYVGFSNSKVDRPLKLLKGFKKIVLAPQETKTVSCDIKIDELAYYNDKTEKWEIEDIEYEIYVGPSSDTKDLLVAKINI
ncbi:glycoside hydrolase family 3 C-terminal domain-containing protein [Halocella sp. SP3-1]|uniref:beta-glucosidase family protein n=1 Tax=Halocella sp. SP3-1 TaxID=2382161 RepID=UPI000F74C91C|nr:glycoside hydrolase family 3 C-terminal domain-containing protein [Halocella sp. SP3-1]AZO93138.1 glycosyl hydrolase [Halocella sp. SP3-1]